ncbi:DUF4191 family protein, partial [Actinomadura adrarensis]
MVAQMLRRVDRKALPITIGASLGTLVVVLGIGLLIGQLWFAIPLAILAAAAVGMIVFGQLAQRAQ